MFQKTSTKLALLYLAIMMAISLFFSASVYQISVQEFRKGFPRQGGIINRLPRDDVLGSSLRNQLIQEQQQRFEEARNRVLARLIFTNLIILVGGGMLSYYLAVRTLRPIEEAHRALEQFTADASHELRTPITAMRSENEVALMNPNLTLKQAKAQLGSNLEELAKLTALAEGLLRLAHLEKGSLALHPVKLSGVVKAASERISSAATAGQVIINVPAGDDMKVLGDRDGLIEVLVILLDNAIKYSPQKSTIEVSVSRHQNQAQVEVKDQGIGILPKDLPHIFDRFYRADAARNKVNDNSYGLGLAIAKNIVELNNGSLTARNNPDKGASFSLRLPLDA